MSLTTLVAARSTTYDESTYRLTSQGKREARALAHLLQKHLKGRVLIIFSTLEQLSEEFPASGETARIMAEQLGIQFKDIQSFPHLGPDKARAAGRFVRWIAQQLSFETVIVVTSEERAYALVEAMAKHDCGEAPEGTIHVPDTGEAIVLQLFPARWWVESAHHASYCE